MSKGIRVYYSGRSIHPEEQGRRAIDVDLGPGMVLVRDPSSSGYSGGRAGRTYTQFQAGLRSRRLVVVAKVPPGSKRGGWITVWPATAGTIVGAGGINQRVAG